MNLFSDFSDNNIISCAETSANCSGGNRGMIIVGVLAGANALMLFLPDSRIQPFTYEWVWEQ